MIVGISSARNTIRQWVSGTELSLGMGLLGSNTKLFHKYVWVVTRPLGWWLTMTTLLVVFVACCVTPVINYWDLPGIHQTFSGVLQRI